jgi:hypothetical protein
MLITRSLFKNSTKVTAFSSTRYKAMSKQQSNIVNNEPPTPCMDEKKPKLFRKSTVKNLTIKNRIVVSPMCQYSCHNMDGIVHDWHFVNLASM